MRLTSSKYRQPTSLPNADDCEDGHQESEGEVDYIVTCHCELLAAISISVEKARISSKGPKCLWASVWNALLQMGKSFGKGDW